MSIQGLIILILFVGGGLGWMVRSARVQRETVAAVRRVGGSVGYNWDHKDTWPEFKYLPPWPRWLVDVLGVDYLGHVVLVWIPGGGSDAELAQVAHLSRIERLGIRSAAEPQPLK